MIDASKMAGISQQGGRLNKLLKSSSVAAMNDAGPVKFLYGAVTSVAPLLIAVDESLELSEKQLELTEAVKDHNVEVYFDFSTESTLAHVHWVTGLKTITIKNGLEIGDRVILAQWQGGQKFTVLDAIERIRQRVI